jgi:hypothetical protein
MSVVALWPANPSSVVRLGGRPQYIRHEGHFRHITYNMEVLSENEDITVRFQVVFENAHLFPRCLRKNLFYMTPQLSFRKKI